MNRCLKRFCNCIRPDQVFKCLKINVVSIDFYNPHSVEVFINDNKNKKKYIDNETPLPKMFPRKKSLFK